MPRCINIQRKHRKLCVGDLNDEIQVLDRAMVAPTFDTPDFDISFSEIEGIFASVNTVAGRTMFDGTNTEVDVTHEFGVYFDTRFTAEDFVLFDGRYFRILKVEDYEERKEWNWLVCSERGTTVNQSNWS